MRAVHSKKVTYVVEQAGRMSLGSQLSGQMIGIEIDQRAMRVLSNTVPGATARGPGAPQASAGRRLVLQKRKALASKRPLLPTFERDTQCLAQVRVECFSALSWAGADLAMFLTCSPLVRTVSPRQEH